MLKNRKIELSTIVGKNSKIEGSFNLKGGVRVDGTIEGTLETDGFITIGLAGYAKASIRAKECLVSGTVVGDIFARETLELDKTAKVTGNISAKNLIINSGACLNGNCRMGENVRFSETESRAKVNAI